MTVTFAVITARNNYKNENSNPASNWGNVFGTDYSSEGNLPWSNEDPAEKDFVVASPSAGADLAFQPGGNQWQAIIELYTVTYGAKYSVSYAAGDGTGSMGAETHRANTSFTLPSSTFIPPANKGFEGWLCSIDDQVYAAGAEYAMTSANTTFTAQYGSVEGKTLIRVTLNGGTSATVTGAIGGTADVSVQSDKKFGSNSYAGFTLAGANTIKKGDIINVRITSASTGGSTYINFYDTSSGTNILQETGTAGVVGDNKFVAGDNLDGKQTIYVCRTSTNGWNAYVDYIEVTRPVSVTIGAYGWATFVSPQILDFTGLASIKAYIVTGHNAGWTAIEKTQITGTVPAGTPLLLEGTTTSVPVAASSSTDVSANKLVAGTGAAISAVANKTRYVLSINDKGTADDSDDIAEFQKIDGTPAIVPVGKAYLEFDGESPAPSLSFDIDNTTGINAVNGSELKVNGEVFNLAGQRVAQPTKGLYIMNGRKVVIK